MSPTAKSHVGLTFKSQYQSAGCPLPYFHHYYNIHQSLYKKGCCCNQFWLISKEKYMPIYDLPFYITHAFHHLSLFYSTSTMDDVVHPPLPNYSYNVDMSRPFRSVKEAVAIFGERILVPEIHTPNLFTFPKKETPFYSPKSPRSLLGEDKVDSDHDDRIVNTVKKLEAELEDTKAELKLIKERESETEVALASLNAELQKNMSKLALAEAAIAKKAGSDGMAAATVIREEEKKRDKYLRMERNNRGSPSLAQILSVEEKETMFPGKTKKKTQQKKKGMKMKPIIPLVGELFNRKKGSAAATALHSPLYASSHHNYPNQEDMLSPFHFQSFSNLIKFAE